MPARPQSKKRRKCKSSFLRKQNKPQLSKFFLEDLRDQRSFHRYMSKGRVNSTDRRSYELIKRTMLVKHYFDWAGAIDRHNRKRMDGLRHELTHEVKVWWKRIVTSFLAVIIVDAYCAFCMEHSEYDQLTFYNELAQEMIFNDFDGAPAPDQHKSRWRGLSRQDWQNGEFPKKVTKRKLLSGEDDEDAQVKCNHVIDKLRNLPGFQGAKDAWLTCRICRKNGATLYCVSCKQNCNDQWFSLCGIGTGRQCLSLHCQTPV